jgi:hypothetical protein
VQLEQHHTRVNGQVEVDKGRKCFGFQLRVDEQSLPKLTTGVNIEIYVDPSIHTSSLQMARLALQKKRGRGGHELGKTQAGKPPQEDAVSR